MAARKPERNSWLMEKAMTTKTMLDMPEGGVVNQEHNDLRSPRTHSASTARGAYVSSMAQLMKRFVLAAAALGLMAGATTRADASIIINISDLTDGVPSVSQSGTTVIPVTILPDSQNEFVHFTFQYAIPPQVFVGTWGTDIFSQAPYNSEALSDRFVLTLSSGSNLIDVQFDSRDTILIPQGNHLSLSQEDGNLNQMFAMQIAGFDVLAIYAASDVELPPVNGPEPSTQLLLGLGAMCMTLGHAWRRRRSGVN
jgi:hypothetical protein